MKIKITGGIEASREDCFLGVEMPWNLRVVSQRGKGMGSLKAAI